MVANFREWIYAPCVGSKVACFVWNLMLRFAALCRTVFFATEFPRGRLAGLVTQTLL